MTHDTVLYRGSKEGSPNPSLLISYLYMYEDNPDNFPTVKVRRNGGISLNPSFGISISEGFDKPRIFIPGMKYYAFVALLEKAVTRIQENLFTLFPNISSTEFEVDSRALEIFQTEKAFTTLGMTAVPAVWSNPTNECFAGVKISNKTGSAIIPLEDAIALVAMFKSFDPIVYAASMLEFFGKIPKVTAIEVTNRPVYQAPQSNQNI
jgi:hypothetical protein